MVATIVILFVILIAVIKTFIEHFAKHSKYVKRSEETLELKNQRIKQLEKDLTAVRKTIQNINNF